MQGGRRRRSAALVLLGVHPGGVGLQRLLALVDRLLGRLPSVRAIGLWLEASRIAQVSTNVEDHRAVALARVIEAVARHATPLRAELVGLAPRVVFEGFPEELPVANRRTVEDALASRQTV